MDDKGVKAMPKRVIHRNWRRYYLAKTFDSYGAAIRQAKAVRYRQKCYYQILKTKRGFSLYITQPAG